MWFQAASLLPPWRGRAGQGRVGRGHGRIPPAALGTGHAPGWVGTSRCANVSRGIPAQPCPWQTHPVHHSPGRAGGPRAGVEPAACWAAVPGGKPRFPERDFSGSCETGWKKITPHPALMAAGPGFPGGAVGPLLPTAHPLTHGSPGACWPRGQHCRSHIPTRHGPLHAHALPRSALSRGTVLPLQPR